MPSLKLSEEQQRDKRAVANAAKAVKAASPANRDEAMKNLLAVVHDRANRPETVDEIVTRERAAMPKAARADAIRAGKSPDGTEAAAIRALWQLPEDKHRERVKWLADTLAKWDRENPDARIDLSGLPRVGDAPEPPPGKSAATTPPDGNWSKPMSQTDMRVRLSNLSTRKFKTFVKQHPLRCAGNRQLWQIQLDGMDRATRKMIEAP